LERISDSCAITVPIKEKVRLIVTRNTIPRKNIPKFLSINGKSIFPIY
jgi:hypothetical protein